MTVRLTITMLVLFWAVADFADTGSDGSSSAATVDFPGCGVAAVYGVIKALDYSVSVEELRVRFQQLCHISDFEQITLKDMRQVIESYGFYAKSVHIGNNYRGAIPSPAILFISSDHLGPMAKAGHVILVRNATSEGAEVVDFVLGEGATYYTYDNLRRFWDGQMIVVSKEPIHEPSNLWFLWSLLISIGAIVIFGKPLYRLLSRARGFLGFGSLLCLLVLPGCTRSDSPLIVEHRVQDMGIIQADQSITCNFILKTWPVSEVSVSSIEKSCNCVNVDCAGTIIGKKYPSNSTIPLKITIEPIRDTGILSEFVLVASEPATNEPLLLEITGVVEKPPTIVGDPFPIECALGQKPVVELMVNQVRASVTKPLELDEGRSNFGVFRVVNQRLETENLHSGGRVVARKDRLTLRLEAGSLTRVGEHRHKLVLGWKGSVLSNEVEAFVRVANPMKLQVEDLFLGEILAGGVEKRRLRLSIEPHGGIRRVNARCHSEWLSAVVSEKMDEIAVTVHVPRAIGRIEGDIEISCDNPAIPPTHLRVGGIVVQ